MARLYGVEVNGKENIISFLMKIYGIGNFRAKYICKDLNIKTTIKISDLSKKDLSIVYASLDNFLLENGLRRSIKFDIKNLIDMKCYRGIRHSNKLPVRGQRTRTNARTRKGAKKTIFKNIIYDKKKIQKTNKKKI